MGMTPCSRYFIIYIEFVISKTSHVYVYSQLCVIFTFCMNVHAHSYILNHVLGNSASMQGIMITMHVYTSKQCMFTILRLWIILKPLLWYFNHWHKSTHPFARLHRVNYACILNNKEIDKIYEQELKHAACIASAWFTSNHITYVYTLPCALHST